MTTQDRRSRRQLLERRLRGLGNGKRDIGRAPRGGPIPLSFAQRRLWFLDQLMPGNTDYLMPLALRFTGSLDVSALQRALDELVARHEILRTRYVARAGEPVQVIDEPFGLDLGTLDLRGHDAHEERLSALWDDVSFDLASGPVIKATLVRLADTQHVLALTLHHIASDGWSEQVLLRELERLYTAFAAGLPAPLAPLPVQYADYAVWQRDGQTGVDRQLGYWRTKLAGLAPLELPYDRARPSIWDSRAARVRFQAGPDTAAALEILAREHNATPFMVYLAAFQVLLGRYANSVDVAVGTPIAGRGHADVQDLVGVFVNTVVLRSDLSGDPSFTEILSRVRETALAAYEHQDVPFERLVDELAPARDLSRPPLCQALFMMQEADQPPAEPTGAGLLIERMPASWVTAKVDLTMSLATTSEGAVVGAIDYATALFDEVTAARLGVHYAQMLDAVAAEPGIPASRLGMVTGAERHKLLVAWNDTEVGYPADRCLHELFERQTERTPDAVALVHNGQRLTYAELDQRANRLAHRLRGLGVGPESLVGVCLRRGVDLVVALLGVLKAGGAYLPLDPEHPRERLEFMVGDAGAEVVIAQDKISDARLVRPEDCVEERDTRLAVTAMPDNLAYLIYTSGSTGRPKGVAVDHRGIVNRIRWMQDRYRLDGTDRVLQKTPFSFDVSVWEFFWPLATGACLVLAEPGGHRDPAYLHETIDANEVTTVHFVPSMLRAFLAHLDQKARVSLRRVICSGEVLPADLVSSFFDRVDGELHNLYGPTEASVDVTAAQCVPGEPVTIGTPVANTRCHVLDANLEPVPVGVPGMLAIAGVQLARGYLARPALTAASFVPNPFAVLPGERLYLTGDMVRYRENGTIEFLGRADHQVKIRGLRLEPGEIEAALSFHPAVRASVVTVHQPTGQDPQLVAYVVMTGGADDLHSYLTRRLPANMVPARFVTLAELPTTTSGKVDRAALPAPDGDRALLATEYVAPRDEAELAIAEAWRTAVGLTRIGVHDNFFAVGGDSIRALRVVGALREQGMDVSTQDLFRHQTVAELARAVAGRAGGTPVRWVERFELLGAGDRELVPDGVVDAYPLSMVQGGMTYEMLAAADRTVYQNVTCYQIRDEVPFSLADLRRAIQSVVDRHDVLRTSFDLSTFSESTQLVHQTAHISVGYTDLRATPDQDAVLSRFLAQERARPFDLTRAPLLRYHVHQISDTAWWLTHTECHAILDGWSHTSVIAQVVAGYRTLRGGASPELAPMPPVRFADFVAEERAELESGTAAKFWTAKLDGLDSLEIPRAWATSEPDTSARIIEIPFGDLEPALRGLATRAGTSMKSVLLTAHLKAMSMVSGRQRFTTGLVCNGRPELPRGDEVLGMYLNTVPYRADVTASTWRELVRVTFAGEAELWPHRRYPLSAMRHEPAALIDVTFTYLDFHVMDWESGDVRMLSDFSPSEFALEVWTFPGVLRLGALPSRIGAHQLDMIGRTHRRVLEAMAEDPDGNIGGLTLAPEDREPVVVVDREAPLRTVVELFEEQVSRRPDAIAARFEQQELSYSELNARANRLAHHLLSARVGPETVVGVSMPRGLDLLATLLGIHKSGGAYLPLDPDYPTRRLAYMRTDSGADVVVTPDTLDSLGDQSQENPPVRARLDDAAYVIYTSGSTGRPKGVHIGHRALANFLATMARTPGFTESDTLLAVTTVGFDIAALELFLPLVTGGAVHIIPQEVATDPAQLREHVEHLRPTVVQATPATWSMLVAAGWTGHRGLRVFCGGEALHRDLADQLASRSAEVWNLYGPTEATIWFSAGQVRTGEPVTLGHPIANCHWRIVGTDLLPVPAGVPGELVLGGVQLARGYLNRPGQTAGQFVPNPFSATPGERWYRTGDLAYRNPDGSVTYLGRIDHQVKIHGHRIELGEIEAVLDEHPDVGLAAVMVHDHRLVAYLAPAADIGSVERFLRQRLPASMVPTQWLPLEAMPLTNSGKIDRSALPVPGRNRPAHAGEYVAPRNTRELVIAQAVAEAIGADQVGIHDDLLRIGLHSLAVMRVAAAIRARHGIELTLRSFVEHRTVAGLSTDGAATSTDTAMVWIRRTGTRTPLFCVHPGGGSAHWYLRLAEHLDTDQPIAAFEWPGPHEDGTPPVELMAERYVAELRQAQPHGPYHLLSWCGGSGIASEIARRLTADEQEVTFLLLDPVVDAHTRSEAWHELELIRRLERLLAVMSEGGDTPERRTEAVDLLYHLVDDVDENTGIALPDEGVGEVWPRLVRIWREVMESDLSYRHRPGAERLHLIVSDELAHGDHEVAFGQTFAEYLLRWQELRPDLRIYRVPGDHFSVMRPPRVARLAEVVTTVLAQNITGSTT